MTSHSLLDRFRLSDAVAGISELRATPSFHRGVTVLEARGTIDTIVFPMHDGNERSVQRLYRQENPATDERRTTMQNIRTLPGDWKGGRAVGGSRRVDCAHAT